MNVKKDTYNAVVYDAENDVWLQFTKPVKVISTHEVKNVLSCLSEVEKEIKLINAYAVGFVSYEASPAFDPALKVKKNNQSLPLLYFVLYKECRTTILPLENNEDNFFTNWEMAVSKEEYEKEIAKVKHNIYEGNTYQVNYTVRQYAKFKGEPLNLFSKLANAQKAKYSAFIESNDFAVCSASPELFFSYNNGKIKSKPMKGTAKRKYILEEDLYQAEWLHNSEKNRAENVMILDMIRNDIGRIAKPGSVKVTEQFKVEKYPTVWQMISTVEAETDSNITEIFKALFPCASITGAPKANTMKIISELENNTRGIYTGAIGFITPDKKAQFNVAIRTVSIDKRKNIAEFGVGGGIVWDSTNKDEFEECRIKAEFLNKKNENFKLLEALLWTKAEGYFLLDYHLKRIKRAADYFDYSINIEKIAESLEKMVSGFTDERYKVRLLVDEFGKIESEAIHISGNYKIGNTLTVIASEPINTDSPFVYYKTTSRSVYNKFKQKYPDYYDVILWNKKGEVTETTAANLVVNIDGNLFTPPVKCGLLAGTFREYLINTGKIKEKVITLDKLRKADNVYLINSVKKWIELKMILKFR